MNKTDKWKNIFKIEMEVEMMACIHGFVMIFAYTGEKFIMGHDNISFLMIIEMGCLAYLTAWIQRVTFHKEKIYRVAEYKLRGVIWALLPSILVVITGLLFNWFSGLAVGSAVFFYALMSAYYIGMWFFLQYIYKEESAELNKLLHQYKEGNSK